MLQYLHTRPENSRPSPAPMAMQPNFLLKEKSLKGSRWHERRRWGRRPFSQLFTMRIRITRNNSRGRIGRRQKNIPARGREKRRSRSSGPVGPDVPCAAPRGSWESGESIRKLETICVSLPPFQSLRRVRPPGVVVDALVRVSAPGFT